MKVLSYLTLTALLSISACSHHKGKACCDTKEKMSCTKENCDKPCCKDKKCTDGSCAKEEKKACCAPDSCQKKS
jgi:hypothetical protein